MDSKSFFDWGAGYAAAGNNNAWSAPASSASAPGAVSSGTAATSSSSRPDDDSKKTNNNNDNNNNTNPAFSGSNTSFSSGGSAFGGGNISFGDTIFNSDSDRTSGIGRGGADQFTKLYGDIGTMQISSSITTSSGPLTTSTASFSASVLASAPFSVQDQTGGGGEGPSSSSSLGEICDSQYHERNSTVTHQEKKASLNTDHCIGKKLID